LLCIKHNAAFTALLDHLSSYYPCYAIVRNPLSTLASWNSIDFNVQKGRSPAAEMLDQSLAKRLSEIEQQIERQLLILSWFFERFERVLQPEHIIRYEALVASGGKALAVITPHALELNEPLENKNKNKLYVRELIAILGEKLLKMHGPFWTFYSKESVEQLLNN
jgi:ribosome-associated protein YbcJ (S4-like RNA binding protein)